jgi:hypothetical protein
MNKTFKFEFPEEDAKSLTYECDETERLVSKVEEGVPVVYLNRPAMITLAKILIQMALGKYQEGFHLHLHEDFNSDARDQLTIVLSPDNAPYGG